MTNLAGIKTQLDERVQAAFTLLRADSQPISTDRDQWLLDAAARQDWDQVLIGLNLHVQKHKFSDDVRSLLDSANQLTAEYKAEGLRRCLIGMSDEEKTVIGECLLAAVDGPFFPDYEFETLIALEIEEVAEIARSWPDVDVEDSRVGMAINNVMNWLRAYPHRQYDRWSEYISVSPDEMFAIYRKWRVLSGRKDNSPSGRAEFFHNTE